MCHVSHSLRSSISSTLSLYLHLRDWKQLFPPQSLLIVESWYVAIHGWRSWQLVWSCWCLLALSITLGGICNLSELSFLRFPANEARVKANLFVCASITGHNFDVAYMNHSSILWSEYHVDICFYDWKTKRFEKTQFSIYFCFVNFLLMYC